MLQDEQQEEKYELKIQKNKNSLIWITPTCLHCQNSSKIPGVKNTFVMLYFSTHCLDNLFF